MRKANITPLTATVGSGSLLLRTITGEPAATTAPTARQLAPEPALVASLATGRTAAAASAGHRGRRSR